MIIGLDSIDHVYLLAQRCILVKYVRRRILIGLFVMADTVAWEQVDRRVLGYWRLVRHFARKRAR